MSISSDFVRPNSYDCSEYDNDDKTCNSRYKEEYKMIYMERYVSYMNHIDKFMHNKLLENSNVIIQNQDIQSYENKKDL